MRKATENNNDVREIIILNFIEWYYHTEKGREKITNALYDYLDDVGAELDGYIKLKGETE